MLDTLVIGAGLCGLDIACRLTAAGRDVLLLEARDRAGGRIETVAADADGVALDLGPAWFWPATQPRMEAMVRMLGLRAFAQHDDGLLLHLPQADGNPEVLAQRRVHEGAQRVEGGMGALVDALLRRLPAERLRTGCAVHRLVDGGDRIEVHARSGDEAVVIVARHVVLALPPRLVAERIVCQPPLDATTMDALRATPTWMAAQAKAVMRLPQASWRLRGQTGNAFVTHPQAVLGEVFDACDAAGTRAALGGFFALPPPLRAACAGVLPLMARSQFAQLFGPEVEAGEPRVRDWAAEPCTCSALDAEDAGAHPDDGVPALAAPLWDGRLCLAGSETASRAAGYLEGALDAAHRVATRLLARAAALPASATNEASVAAFADWVATTRRQSVELYRHAVVRALSAWRSDAMTHAVLREVVDHVFGEALMQVEALPFDLAGVPVERGRCALTPRLLAAFSGFSDALLEAAIEHNRTSCALSNFPDEHAPAADYVLRIRSDLAVAWRAFALSLNRALLDRMPVRHDIA